MAGLVPAIHVFPNAPLQGVDARDKFTTGPAFGRTRLPGHDGGEANGIAMHYPAYE